jgi:hypothetical protein
MIQQQQNTTSIQSAVRELEIYLARKLTVEEYLAVKNDFEQKNGYKIGLPPAYPQPVYVKDRWVLPTQATCTTTNNAESIGEFWDKQDQEASGVAKETRRLNENENKEAYFKFWDSIGEYPLSHEGACDCVFEEHKDLLDDLVKQGD